MKDDTLRSRLIAAATPLFADKGLNGVGVRELARAGGSNVSMISYYFGGKAGLYQAVLREVFSGMLEMGRVASANLDPTEKFMAYVYECGICYHSASGEEFVPRTVSADRNVPECPHCLNNDAGCFTETRKTDEIAA